MYGAEAYFIFEKQVDNETEIRRVNGELKVAIEALVSITGEGSVDFDESQRELVRDMRVRFHGDVVLDTNPATYEQAIQVRTRIECAIISKCWSVNYDTEVLKFSLRFTF